jgi:hypothetical protein
MVKGQMYKTHTLNCEVLEIIISMSVSHLSCVLDYYAARRNNFVEKYFQIEIDSSARFGDSHLSFQLCRRQRQEDFPKR